MSQIETLEKLDELGAQGLDWLAEFSKNGLQFVEEQAPELCNEIIRLGIVNHGFWFVSCLIVCIASLVLTYKLFKWIMADTSAPPEALMICVLPFGSAVGFGIATMVSLHAALIIWVAPRVYLLEYFADMVKG